VFTEIIFFLAKGPVKKALLGREKNQRSLERDGIEGETPVWFIFSSFPLRRGKKGKRFFRSNNTKSLGKGL